MGALYDLAVAAHVVLVLGALLAIAVAGGYQAAVAAGSRSDGVTRYFRGRPSWGPRLLAPAALLGLLAAGLSRGRVHVDAGWVLGAAALWLGAMAAIESLLLPAEKALIATPDPSLTSRSIALKGLAGAAVALAGVVAASVLMTVQ